MPGQLLYNLPFGNIARVPLRFGLGLMLGLAVCGAFGLAGLISKMQFSFPRLQAGLTLPLVAGGLIFLEFLPLPRALVDTRIPSFYQQIREEGRWNDFAVLEMPDSVTTYSMYYQTEHHHPILNAYLSRNPECRFNLKNAIFFSPAAGRPDFAFSGGGLNFSGISALTTGAG